MQTEKKQLTLEIIWHKVRLWVFLKVKQQRFPCGSTSARFISSASESGRLLIWTNEFQSLFCTHKNPSAKLNHPVSSRIAAEPQTSWRDSLQKNLPNKRFVAFNFPSVHVREGLNYMLFPEVINVGLWTKHCGGQWAQSTPPEMSFCGILIKTDTETSENDLWKKSGTIFHLSCMTKKKKNNKKNLDSLCQIHPFLKNIYHGAKRYVLLRDQKRFSLRRRGGIWSIWDQYCQLLITQTDGKKLSVAIKQPGSGAKGQAGRKQTNWWALKPNTVTWRTILLFAQTWMQGSCYSLELISTHWKPWSCGLFTCTIGYEAQVVIPLSHLGFMCQCIKWLLTSYHFCFRLQLQWKICTRAAENSRHFL